MYLRKYQNIFGFLSPVWDLGLSPYTQTQSASLEKSLVLLVKLTEFYKLGPLTPETGGWPRPPLIPQYTSICEVTWGIGGGRGHPPDFRFLAIFIFRTVLLVQRSTNTTKDFEGYGEKWSKIQKSIFEPFWSHLVQERPKMSKNLKYKRFNTYKWVPIIA